MKKYCFRVDGGDVYSIATGHITRCLKLADFISRNEKADIYFIMKQYKGGIALVEKKYKVLPLSVELDIPGEIAFIKKAITDNSYFICDTRNVTKEYVAEIKKMCLAFVLFDDLSAQGIAPDMLINPTPFCSDDYNYGKYPGTMLCLGEKYFFANEALLDKAHERHFDKEKYNILASFGGADPCNITEFFINNIAPKLKKHNISIVLGPAYAGKAEVLERYRRIDSINFFTDIFPLDGKLLENDIAFVSGGDTCIEACASGAATFIISSIYYEKKIGELLHRNKMAYFVSDIDDIKDNMFDESYLDVLAGDKKTLGSISRAGMTLVDSRGLGRVYKLLTDLPNKRRENVQYDDGIYKN